MGFGPVVFLVHSLSVCNHLLDLLADSKSVFNPQVSALSVLLVRNASVSSGVPFGAKGGSDEAISATNYTFDVFRE